MLGWQEEDQDRLEYVQEKLTMIFTSLSTMPAPPGTGCLPVVQLNGSISLRNDAVGSLNSSSVGTATRFAFS